MSFGRVLCPVLTVAVMAAGCSQAPTAPTAPTAVALGQPGSASQADSPSSEDATYSPSTAINPPRGLGVARLVAFGDSITWGATSAFTAGFIYAGANGGYVERLESN